jgi:hypothetical protein
MKTTYFLKVQSKRVCRERKSLAQHGDENFDAQLKVYCTETKAGPSRLSD